MQRDDDGDGDAGSLAVVMGMARLYAHRTHSDPVIFFILTV